MDIQRSRLKFGRKLAGRARFGMTAAQYFQDAGVTDPTGRREMGAFINTLRDLGVWQPTILGMALASRHNAGTGTRAYAFRGAYGTLTNGPAWGTSGILMDGLTTTIDLSTKLLYAGTIKSAFVVTKVTAAPTLCNFVLAVDDGTATGIQIGLRMYSGGLGDPGPGLYVTRGSTGSLNLVPGRNALTNQWQTFATSMDSSTDQVYQNGALVTGGNRTSLPPVNPVGTPTTAALGGGSGTGACTQTAAVILLLSAPITLTTVCQLHEAVRQILLPEIGLPSLAGVPSLPPIII